MLFTCIRKFQIYLRIMKPNYSVLNLPSSAFLSIYTQHQTTTIVFCASFQFCKCCCKIIRTRFCVWGEELTNWINEDDFSKKNIYLWRLIIVKNIYLSLLAIINTSIWAAGIKNDQMQPIYSKSQQNCLWTHTLMLFKFSQQMF